MASKLGLHINFVTQRHEMLRFVEEAKPAIVKVLHFDEAFLRGAREVSPETLIVGRYYVEQQPLDDPEKRAEQFARRILATTAVGEGLIRAWEGYNEIDTNEWPNLRRLARFDLRMARVLHEEGLEYVAGSYGVGHPTDVDFTQIADVRAAFAEADYIGVHEYYAPRLDDQRNFDANGKGWWLLRYRNWYSQLPEACQKPLLVTECGIDSGAPHHDPGAQGGWRSFTDAEGYMQQLAWYDRQLQGDDYVKAAAIFCWGTLDPRWASYDITGDMAQRLQGYIVCQQQGDEESTPPPPPGGEGWVDLRRELPRHPVAKYERRKPDAIERVVIHHSAVTADVGPERIAAYHVNDRRYPGIGYHFCVGADGTTYWCNDLETVSYHVAGHNDETVGICLLGCFTGTSEPTEMQISATKELLKVLDAHLRFPALSGHKDLVATRCPGDTWHLWKSRLKESDEVARLRRLLEEIERLAKMRE